MRGGGGRDKRQRRAERPKELGPSSASSSTQPTSFEGKQVFPETNLELLLGVGVRARNLSVLSLCRVGLHEEVSKQGEHGDHVEEEDPDGEDGEVLGRVDEEHVGRLGEVEAELEQLERRDVLLVEGGLVPARLLGRVLLRGDRRPEVVA